MLAESYYSLNKIAMPRGILAGGLLGAGVGALYGIGDSDSNYYNHALTEPTYARSAQGAASGLAGAVGYNLARSYGRGRAISGLLGLLSAGGLAALSNPTFSRDTTTKLPF